MSFVVIYAEMDILLTSQKRPKNSRALQIKDNFQVGDFVFAKVRGYVEWPSYIIDLDEKFVWVKFFNSTERYIAIFDMICDISKI